MARARQREHVTARDGIIRGLTPGRQPDAQRRSIIEQLVEKHSTFAPGWDAYVNIVTDPAERLRAIARGLAARPDADTRGSLLVKKAMTDWDLGDQASAERSLRELASNPAETLSTQASAQIILARLVGRPQDTAAT